MVMFGCGSSIQKLASIVGLNTQGPDTMGT